MTDINQNFSLCVGDATKVQFDVGPDVNGLNLEFVDALTWKVYRQAFGIPDKTIAVIAKAVGSGIEITDPLLMQFTVVLASTDTIGLAGNFFHEVKIDAGHGAITTTTTGLMTVIDPALAPNVIAFKSMFPDFEKVDDTLVQIALDAAGQFIDESWGTAQVPATMYLVAHFLSMAMASASGTTGQVVTSESIGRISVSYATAASAGTVSSTLTSTTYGITFNNMLMAQGFGIAVV